MNGCELLTHLVTPVADAIKRLNIACWFVPLKCTLMMEWHLSAFGAEIEIENPLLRFADHDISENYDIHPSKYCEWPLNMDWMKCYPRIRKVK